MSVAPRHVVCLLGQWSSFDDVEAIVAEVGGEGFSLDDDYSILAPDPRMKRAFEVSADRVTPSFDDDDRAAVAAHRAVAYVLSPPMSAQTARGTSARMLSVVRALLDRGGATAAKSESAGIAHGRPRWIRLADAAARGDRLSSSAALAEAWVRRPLEDEDRAVFYSCGMHLLGEPDVEVPSEMNPGEAVTWIDALAIYLLAEKPDGGVRPGETFRPSEDHPRRVLGSTLCERYEEDDFFHNPYGYWNLAEVR